MCCVFALTSSFLASHSRIFDDLGAGALLFAGSEMYRKLELGGNSLIGRAPHLFLPRRVPRRFFPFFLLPQPSSPVVYFFSFTSFESSLEVLHTSSPKNPGGPLCRIALMSDILTRGGLLHTPPPPPPPPPPTPPPPPLEPTLGSLLSDPRCAKIDFSPFSRLFMRLPCFATQIPSSFRESTLSLPSLSRFFSLSFFFLQPRCLFFFFAFALLSLPPLLINFPVLICLFL